MKADPGREGVRARTQRPRAPAPPLRSEHAVLALQRAAGNRATTRLLQRKIGFEFEMDTLFSAFATPVTDKEKTRFASQVLDAGQGKPIGKDFTKFNQVQPRDHLGSGRLIDSQARQREGPTTADHPGDKDSPPEFLGDEQESYRLHALSKKDVIVRRPGFNLEADEGNTDKDGLAYSNTEFVTAAFDETPPGRKELETALAGLIEVTDAISALSQQGRRVVHATEVAPGGGQVGKVLIPTTLLGGALQVTGGVELSQIGRLMQGMQADTEESKESRGQRLEERNLLGGGLGPEPGIIGSAPRRAEEGLAFALSQWDGPHPPAKFGSTELKSFVALIAAYMKTAAGATVGYAKTIAPLMARTDFATMFTLVPEHQFLADNFDLFRSIVSFTAALPMSEKLFPNGLYKDARSAGRGDTEALAGLTRFRWLFGITDGIDYLTAANFNKNPAAQADDPTAPKRDLESMGARGNTTERVGWFNKPAPIFEIRALGQIHSPRAFSERALMIFDYLEALNLR